MKTKIDDCDFCGEARDSENLRWWNLRPCCERCFHDNKKVKYNLDK